MEVARVRRLDERDIDDAIELTDLEAWGYTPADFRRLLALAPEGCFAAEVEGRLVGVLTTTTYDRLAFLGAVIVRPELRGKGIGAKMMQVALDHLRSRGVRTVRLNAYVRAIPFYERLGFRGEYDVLRWRGNGTAGRMSRVRPLRVADIAGLLAFDATYFGARRDALVGRLAAEFPDTFLVAVRGGMLRGYIVGNSSGDSCEIGPWVVEPEAPNVAEDLYHGLVAASGATSLAFSGPHPNGELRELVQREGLEEVFRTLRMRHGEDALHATPDAIWALAGLEKG